MAEPTNFLSALGPIPDIDRAFNQLQAGRLSIERAGLQNQLLGAEVQQQRTAAMQADAYQRDVAAALENPTARSYSDLFAKHPQFKDAINKSWETRDASARQGDLSQLGQLHAALKGGRKDLAIKMLQSRIDADREAGASDDQDRLYLDALMNDDPNDDATVLGMTGAAVAAITGPDQYAKTYDAIGADGQRKGQIVGRTIGHYDETGKFVTDYRDPEPAQYRTVSDGESLVEVQPGGAAPVAAPGGAAMGRSDVLARIEAIEGIGQNPLSSSVGVGQFTNATWLATFKKHGSAAGKSDAEILALRTNPNVARPMLAALVRDHEAKLTADGHAVTPGNIYLSHFLGQGGASKVLSADPSTPMTKLVTPGAIAANKSLLQGKTAGDVIAWTAQRMAGGGSGGSGGARVVAKGAAKQKDPPSGYRWVGDALEAIPGGPGDKTTAGPGGTIDRKGEMTLRKEFNSLPQVKEFQTIRGQFQQIQTLAKAPNAQNDIAMIFSYMKMLDPTSVVREGEFATAQNATGIPDQWKNAYNKALSGERLNAAQRNSMVASAARVYKQQRETYNSTAAQYRGYAEQSGFDPKRIAQRYVPTGKPAAGGVTRIRSQQEYARLPSGTVFIDPTGKTRTKR